MIRSQPRREAISWLVFVLWFAGTALFVLLAFGAAMTDRFPVDLHVARTIQSHDWPPVPAVEEIADVLGSPPAALGLLSALALLCLFLRRYNLAATAVTLMLLRAVGFLIKDLVGRPRPSASEVDVRAVASGFSFPSGHALSACLVGLLVVVIAQECMSGSPRRLVQAAGVTFVALIGWERVYDGVHWPSDVAAGYLLGALLLVAVIPLWRRVFRAETPSGTHGH